MATQAISLKNGWHSALRLIGVKAGKYEDPMLARTESRLNAILTGQGTIKLDSNMQLPLPEIRMPKTDRQLPAELKKEIQDCILTCFGTNRRFVKQFAAFLSQDPETLEANLGHFEIFLNSVRQMGYKPGPGRLIPLLYDILIDRARYCFLGKPKELSGVLQVLGEMIKAKKDPIKETGFDLRVEMLMRTRLDNMPLQLFLDCRPLPRFLGN